MTNNAIIIRTTEIYKCYNSWNSNITTTAV